MKEIIVKTLVTMAFLSAAMWLLTPRFSTAEVFGFFFVMVAAAI
ncbi:MAG TPA: hypothetical protein VJ846_11555 [Sphingomicrobium sp.]|nr:hypothetical protein [Sphingomicrobium sp.]